MMRMHTRIINGVSPGTLEIIYRKITDKKIKDIITQNNVTAVGLCSGEVIDMLVASDIAQKASNVVVSEISGTCPQHFISIGIFGDIASVETAIKAIESSDYKL